ncbi:hypothetical protein E8E13_006646 [Curvularia kusanoi]|uniref:C2H2-type domain-containing protein n=1 Tax=Curvularia kusanoi TaxID=90978 RepID=A0A9P4TCJ7_CURKU|nr:hypothetical protein E8E13_006646 [Curvularia kusanoi]
MQPQQFGDLPQIYGMDESYVSGWSPDLYPYSYVGKQEGHGFTVVDNNGFFDGLGHGVMSMPPLQRFMFDLSPQTDGLLHANIPLQSLSEQYVDAWHSSEAYRNESPDRTSVSGTSSYASHNEASSPHLHNYPYGTPDESCQPLPTYHSMEQFSDNFCMTGSQGASICPKQIEFAENEPELMIEDAELTELKQEPATEYTQASVKTEPEDSVYRDYSDSDIDNQVRDAESVQPIDFKDEADEDSDYKPTSRNSGKRKRSAAHTARASRRRSGARKDSVVSNTGGNKPSRRRGSTKKSDGDIQRQDDRKSFPCPLTEYNCTSTFASKNEWKRHVSTQHIKLGYWRCDLCPPTTDPNDPSVLYYNDFNRKDLFTQHLRRMHAAHGTGARHLKEHPVNDDNIGEHQTRCYLRLRTAPQQSICPLSNCDVEFIGPKSWEERMDHVGRHLEKDGDKGIDLSNVTNWKHDSALENYLVAEDLIVWESGTWRISDGKERQINA